MEIEEKYERSRRSAQFSKWSDEADALTGLPVLDNKRKGWHIPTNPLKKKARGISSEPAADQDQDVSKNLSKTELRRLKEIKKEAEKLKKNKQSKVKDSGHDGEVKVMIRSPGDVARICDMVMSNPEETIELLIILLEYCEKNWNSKAKKGSDLGKGAASFPIELAVISLVLVVKDLVPGYKVSNQIIGLEGGGSESNDKVSLRKETQKIHSFERSVLNVYKRTCLLLKRMLGLGGRGGTTLSGNKSAILRSSMDLLDATYHFNHHIILLRMIILFLMSGNCDDPQTKQCLSYCSEGLTNVLVNDTSLETGVESVDIIYDTIFNRKSKKNVTNEFTLTKWVLIPFTKFAPWHRIDESRNEFRRIFGPNASSVSKEIIDEIQQTSTTRVKVEILVEREEQILKHLFTFYSKVLLLDLDELEYVYQGISHYSNRISLKVRSELIDIIKNKLYKSESLRWPSFLIVLRCCFSLLQRGCHLNEQQLEDNSWILRYLVLRLEKERASMESSLNSTKSTDKDYLDEMASALQDAELPTVILNTSIFSSSNSSYLYRLILVIAEISNLLSKYGQDDSSLFLLKLCGQLIIKYPKLKVLLDPEGIPCNDFPIDANSILSTWKYQELSLYCTLNEILESPKSNPRLRLACNMLLTESSDDSVRKNAIASIKKYFKGKKDSNDGDCEPSKKAIEELKSSYYILKLVNM
ncbi:Noc3 like protein [Cryptosporidium canis]|nr:Noc3 like protein [Cryptosporidium canis]